MKEIKGQLIFATVADDASGIHLRIATDDNKLEVAFLPVNEQLGDISLILKDGMDAKKELQTVCNLLNGYSEKKDGTLIPMSGYKPRNITIKIQ